MKGRERGENEKVPLGLALILVGAVIVIVGANIAGFVYGPKIRETTEGWFTDAFGFSAGLIMIPLFSIYLIYKLISFLKKN